MLQFELWCTSGVTELEEKVRRGSGGLESVTVFIQILGWREDPNGG